MMTLDPIGAFIVRQSLFVVPLVCCAVLLFYNRNNARILVAALFVFLFQFGVMFALQLLAFELGWWQFGGDALKLLGFPADIWFGCAFLWGPVFYLAFKNYSPLWLVAPNILINALVMPRIAPVLIIGDGWMLGQILLVVGVIVPGQYLARWTQRDDHLPLRSTLLAMMHATVAFLVIPSAIMKAMGGSWSDLAFWWPHPVFFLGVLMILLCFQIGLSAVQLFAIHGGGTPIPFDHTKRLVRTGLYAYLSNPMQMCTALVWLILGFLLHNIWIALGAVMAVVFVLGMVRWHNRQDLGVRFPDRWPEYKAHVPEWTPRWKPWIPDPVTLSYHLACPLQSRLVRILLALHPVNLNITSGGPRLTYREPNETRYFYGSAAIAKALNHTNFILALAASVLLLFTLMLDYCKPTKAQP